MPATATITETPAPTGATASPAPDLAPVALRGSGASTKGLLAGDKVREHLKDVKPEHRDLVLWLHDYQWKNGLSYEALAKKLIKANGQPYDRHSVYAVFGGLRAEGSIERICEAIRAFRELVEQRSMIQRAGFTRTSLTETIWEACDAARIYQKIVLVYGDTQVGKTRNLEEYTLAHNHGKTVFVSVPEGGRIGPFVSELCRMLNLPERMQINTMAQRVINSFRDDMLLIVDEGHQPFVCGETLASYRVFEFIRLLYERTKCGVVISATDKLREVTKRGRFKGILSQFLERQLCTINLPAKPTASDLNLFAAKYQLPPATGAALALQNDVIKHRSISIWLTILSAASRIAANDERHMTWPDVITAHDTLKAMEGGQR